MTKKIRGLLFDKDGTLIDLEKTWYAITYMQALRAADGDDDLAHRLLEESGYDFENGRFIADSLIGRGAIREIVQLWHPNLKGKRLEEEIEYYKRFGEVHSARSAVEIDGVTDALWRLKQAGYILGIASNDTRKGATATVELMGCYCLFSDIIGYDTTSRPKPAPDQVMHFAQTCQLDPAEIAVIGDHVDDIQAGRAAGVGLAIGVLSGNSSLEVLAPICDGVLPSVASLPEWLSAHGVKTENIT